VRVVTWNVLHRVHGETHRERCLVRWPDEARRVEGVVSAVRGFGADAVLLQEVSGDRGAQRTSAGSPDRSGRALEEHRPPTRSPSPPEGERVGERGNPRALEGEHPNERAPRRAADERRLARPFRTSA
jgi:hypothetical protein